MHDPFQAYSGMGAYPGMFGQSSSPYTQQGFSSNPAFNPLAAALGAFAFNPAAGIMQGGRASVPTRSPSNFKQRRFWRRKRQIRKRWESRPGPWAFRIRSSRRSAIR